jgi:hypothetical protein
MSQVIKPQPAIAAVKRELINQKTQRFRMEGASDGPNMKWLPRSKYGPSGRSLLKGLENTFVMKAGATPDGFWIEYGVGGKDAKIANIHQSGTPIGKDIEPRAAKALFIPLTGLAKRSFLTYDVLTGRRMRHGIKGSRRGLEPKVVQMKKGKMVVRKVKTPRKLGVHWTQEQGERYEEKMSGDFILRRRIKATPEKGGRAIPQRPIARLTDQNIERIVNAILASQIKG